MLSACIVRKNEGAEISIMSLSSSNMMMTANLKRLILEEERRFLPLSKRKGKPKNGKKKTFKIPHMHTLDVAKMMK